jgi:NAD+ synthase (glutamine-hydrolysing)
MRRIKLGAATLNQTPLDWEGNFRRITQAVSMAKEEEVGLLCLPEMTIPGYGCQDTFHSMDVVSRSWEILERLIPQTRGLAVAVGLPVLTGAAVYDAVALIVSGQLMGIGAKRHLAGDGVHYEPRWFKPWPVGGRSFAEHSAGNVPMGDYIFEIGGLRVGFEICEEAWVADRPGADLAHLGVDVILNPSASHFAFGKQQVRERFILDGSRAFGVAYVYANLLGNGSGRIIYDGSCLIAEGGEMLASGPRLVHKEVVLTTAVVDVARSRMRRARSASFQADPIGDDERLVSAPMPWPEVQTELPHAQPAVWEQGEHRDEEAFTRAVALGLLDYLRKSWTRGWMISLSGGADSAAVTALCSLALRLAADELGLDGLKKRLSYIPAVQEADDIQALCKTMITTVYQSTQNSGEVTRIAAEAVAEAFYSTHHVWSVETQVRGYSELIETVLGRELSWDSDDLALQNIQARARAPGIWMLANMENKLLLATSNRSEAAVGYATMDGDTCGGLSPIAGIDKAFLRRWLRWLESTGPHGQGPIPSLRVVNNQAPTAELRPAEQGQTDEDDLMPYPVLDAIEKAAIRDKLAPVEVARQMRVIFPETPLTQHGVWIRRFFELWTRNQWKRERFAPSFHLDDENLDPKTWCRFPILSGGYRAELVELDHWIEEQTNRQS